MRELQELANITRADLDNSYNYGKYFIKPQVFWDREVLYVIFDSELKIRGIARTFDDAKFKVICMANFK